MRSTDTASSEPEQARCTTTTGEDEHRSDASSPTALRDQVIRHGRSWQVAKYGLISTLTAYDRSGDWAFAGFVTCAHWAAQELDVTVGTAREWLRIGHILERLPLVDVALKERRLSYCKVRTLTRIATDHPTHEQELVELAESVPAGELPRALARWTGAHEDAETRDRRHRRETYLSSRTEPDGMGTLVVRLPALEMASVLTVIDAVVEQRAKRPRQRPPEPTESDSDAPMDAPATPGVANSAASSRSAHERNRATMGQQRADAFVEAMTGAEGADLDSGSVQVSTEVIVHLRSDGCTLHDGSPITNSVVEGLIDEAFIRVMIHDAESHPINVSGRHRYPTDRQKRVIDEIHRACVDCGSTDLLQYDHVPDFAVSRRTVIEELVRRCAPCHRARHADEGADPAVSADTAQR
jgi:hypothetical protein